MSEKKEVKEEKKGSTEEKATNEIRGVKIKYNIEKNIITVEVNGVVKLITNDLNYAVSAMFKGLIGLRKE